MSNIKYYLLVAVLLSLSCTSSQVITKDEFEVYSVILEDQIQQGPKGGGNTDKIQLTIEDSTKIISALKTVRTDSKISQFSKKYFIGSREDSYYFKNVEHYYISNNFNINMPNVKVTVETISKKQRKDLFSKGGWEAYYQKYPQSMGIIHLSRVGFSCNKKTAKVYLGKMWGLLAGEGYEITLEKQKEGWIIKTRERTWSS